MCLKIECKLLRGLNYIEEKHKMFTYIILIGPGKYMYLNTSVDQLKKKKTNLKHFQIFEGYRNSLYFKEI